MKGILLAIYRATKLSEERSSRNFMAIILSKMLFEERRFSFKKLEC